MAASSAIVPNQHESTSFETFTRGKLAGLFSRLLRSKAEERHTCDVNNQSVTAGIEDARQKELSQIASQWRHQEISMLMEQWTDSQEPSSGEAITSRLLSLRRMLQEEEGQDADISPDSLRSFFAFLRRLPRATRPEITLTPEREIYVRWKCDSSRVFAVHFLSDEKVRFIVFWPNARHPRLMNRLSGLDAVDTVLETADNACSVREWIQG